MKRQFTLRMRFAFSAIVLFSFTGLMAQDIEVYSDTIAVNPVDTVAIEEIDALVIPPLFEYVTAPEDLPDLKSRTNYLMDHFWDPFDTKEKGVVDQNALNHAFGVYINAMMYADDKKVSESVKNLIKRLKGNPVLSLQFAKAAEETLYGPRADFWADDIYVQFLQNLIDNKKVDAGKKKRYIAQLNLLKSTAVGAKIPDLKLLTQEKTITHLNPTKDFSLIGFINTDCDDCRYSNAKLDISGIINDMIEDQQLDVILISTDTDVEKGNLPEKWRLLTSENASEIMDLRFFPDFYIIDRNGVIQAKNLDVDRAIDYLNYLRVEKK